MRRSQIEKPKPPPETPYPAADERRYAEWQLNRGMWRVYYPHPLGECYAWEHSSRLDHAGFYSILGEQFPIGKRRESNYEENNVSSLPSFVAGLIASTHI